MTLLWILQIAVAGIAVVLAGQVARRVSARWSGVAAAAPVTPTMAVLVGGPLAAETLTQGLPMVTGVAVALLVIAWAAHRVGAPALWVAGGALALGPVTSDLPLAFHVSAIILLAVAAETRFRGVADPPVAPRGIGHPARFAIGSGSMVMVLAAARWAPAVYAWVALVPLLFVVGLGVAQADGGTRTAAKVAHGGIAGTVGVTAFVVTIPVLAPYGLPWALAAAWLAYLVVAFAWSLTFARQIDRLPTMAHTGLVREAA